MRWLLIVTLCVVLTLPGAAAAPPQDKPFEALAQRFIDAYLELNPESATQLGEHRYDGRLTDYSPAGLDRQRKLYQSTLAELKTIDRSALSPDNQVDASILQTNLEYGLFSLDTLREQDWNPLTYNPGGGLNALIARDFAPLSERLNSLALRLDAVPRLLEQARANLKNPPLIFTETAISQNKGTIGLIQDDLEQFVAQDAAARERLTGPRQHALQALKDFGHWLETDLKPRSKGNFRLGKEKFREKLSYALESDLTQEQILERAQVELKKTHEDMVQVAHQLGFDGPDGVRRALKAAADHHPDNATIVSNARQVLAECTEFVRAHDLVRVPDEPLKVIEMPEFARGVATAYCDAPGPLEKKGETFFAISPTPKDWSPERVNSFYREYNDFMLVDLTVHEAMPGHYLQLAHAARFKAPTRLRAIFGSGTFVEGWATYAEQVMAQAGNGGPQVRLQQLKMRLRLIINAILDQKIHCEGMTEKQAMDLMMNEGFQEEGEAAGKWRRACLSSTQLSTYFVGNTEVNDLRTAYQAKHPQATLREIHDAILSFGSPAPRYIKRLLGL